MVRRIEWMRIPREDFDKLYNAFYCHERECGKDYGAELIDLAEEYKSYATEYNGRRYVFVFVRDMNDERKGLAGFVVYDKSSKKVLFTGYYYDEYPDLVVYNALLLIHRIAREKRFDVLEYLFFRPRESIFLIYCFLSFLEFSRRYLGDELIKHFYRNYKDVIDRIERNKLIYGRNFVYIPWQRVGLIRLSDGTIVFYKPSSFREYHYIVSKLYDPLIHRFFSGLIDYAEDLEKNMVTYDSSQSLYGYRYILSSVSLPSWFYPSRHWIKSSIALVSTLKRDTSDGEYLSDIDIYLIGCNEYCDMYSLGKVIRCLEEEIEKHVICSSSRLDREGRIFLKYINIDDEKYRRFLEYVIGFRERFPQKFVEEAFERYLHMNVMNVS
jgi:hypothetical protein